jgi:deoxyribonuclease V
MKAALDVHYDRGSATAACVVFDSWQDSTPVSLTRVTVSAAAQYRPGRFYERELPCLLSVLEQVGHHFETIVVDGYVHLRSDVGKGLGAWLHKSLPYSAVVIGVAKNRLKVADRFVPINRGASKKPLYVSAIGCSLEQAARSIASMHGRFRIPTLLKIADRNARGQS